MIVKGSTPEFDYPKGKDGVPIGNAGWRSLFSWYYGDPTILLSGDITQESRILLHLDIQDRVRTLVPRQPGGDWAGFGTGLARAA